MEAPKPFTNTFENEISININQENKDYLLNIEIKGETANFILYYSNELDSAYSLKMSLSEIKKLHQLLEGLKSLQEFCEYLKALSKSNKITISIKDNFLFINFEVEYLLNKNYIEIQLKKEKLENESIVKNLCKEIKLIKERMNSESKCLRDDIENLKNENLLLKEEMKEIKNKLFPKKELTNKENIFTKSVIMKDDEFDFINSIITKKFNKEIKEIKKLFQASIDGDKNIDFHTKCDNFPNTLTVVQSKGNRRFGGFTSQIWESKEEGVFKDDKYAFLFSLDKKKIYKYKNDNKAIYVSKYYGPTFGNGFTLFISDKAIETKNSFTFESDKNCSYDFNGDSHALSEDGNINRIFLVDYEVFQIIFN